MNVDCGWHGKACPGTSLRPVKQGQGEGRGELVVIVHTTASSGTQPNPRGALCSCRKGSSTGSAIRVKHRLTVAFRSQPGHPSSRRIAPDGTGDGDDVDIGAAENSSGVRRSDAPGQQWAASLTAYRHVPAAHAAGR